MSPLSTNRRIRLGQLSVFALALTGSLGACRGPDKSPTDPGDPIPAAVPGSVSTRLNFFEEQLVGVWRRYHRYDDSYQYYVFKADRTACKWDEMSGNTGKVGFSRYSSWSIDDKTGALGGNRYRVSGLSLDVTFDYPKKEVYPSQFPILIYTPAGGRTC